MSEDQLAAPSAASSEAAPAAVTLALVKKHPRAIRWMHWINFPLLTIMIWSTSATMKTSLSIAA